MSKLLLAFFVCCMGILLAGCRRQTAEESVSSGQSVVQPTRAVQPKEGTASALPKSISLAKPEMTIDTANEYRAILHTTEGDITIKLTADKTPITVNNFVYLAENRFYGVKSKNSH